MTLSCSCVFFPSLISVSGLLEWMPRGVQTLMLHVEQPHTLFSNANQHTGPRCMVSRTRESDSSFVSILGIHSKCVPFQHRVLGASGLIGGGTLAGT